MRRGGASKHVVGGGNGAAGPDLRGSYRDVVIAADGTVCFDSGWCSNTITGSAWLLMAGLMGNRPALRGILFWAVGAGDAAWDTALPVPDPATTRLQTEWGRAPVTGDAIGFLDGAGNPTTAPTTRLEVRANFHAAGAASLREFGLFGGDAVHEPNTGYLVNYVVHPRLDLEAGTTLSRRLRLRFRSEEGGWIELPQHWLGASEVTLLDGVGTSFAAALDAAGVTTVAQLAEADPAALEGVLPLMKAIELRAKARLALRTAAQLRAASGLRTRTVWDVLLTPPAALAAEGGVPEEQAAGLREQVSVLELTLDHRFLRRITIGELMAM